MPTAIEHPSGSTAAPRPLDDPALEERVAELEATKDFPPELTSSDWVVVAVTTFVLPLFLIIVAWYM